MWNCSETEKKNNSTQAVLMKHRRRHKRRHQATCKCVQIAVCTNHAPCKQYGNMCASRGRGRQHTDHADGVMMCVCIMDMHEVCTRCAGVYTMMHCRGADTHLCLRVPLVSENLQSFCCRTTFDSTLVKVRLRCRLSPSSLSCIL